MKACVDIGGTKVAVSRVADSDSRQLLQRRSAPTVKTGDPLSLARQLIALIESACADQGLRPGQLEGIGVASCGPFLYVGDQLELAAPNICGGIAGPARGLPNDWPSAPLEAPLRARFPHTRLRIENDGIAALEAERRWGALQGSNDCAYVTWSTGIGTGLCVGGRVLRGKQGNAGHAGHSFVSDEAPDALCGCGNRGDVEALAAGNAIARRFGEDAADLLARARSGDTEALARVDALCATVGRLLYNLIVTLDLERISLGGSVFLHHHDFLLPRLRAHIDGRQSALTRGCTLLPAGLGERVADYAALALLD